jgi:hypothetical protein
MNASLKPPRLSEESGQIWLESVIGCTTLAIGLLLLGLLFVARFRSYERELRQHPHVVSVGRSSS